jgi:hypothetical protein
MLTKLLIMYKLTFLFLFFSIYAHSQVVPIGTVIKGKRLPTLTTGNLPDKNNRSATLYGSIKINDSKLSIVENGFVVLATSDSRVPDFFNATKFAVATGIGDFQTTINSFASNTSYKYRAYAKNSKGELAYSQIITFTTFTDYCEINPCKNAASLCTSYSWGPTCTCTWQFCGNCCAQLADEVRCPGGAEYTCDIIYARGKNLNLKIIQINERLTMNNKWYNNQIANKAILK